VKLTFYILLHLHELIDRNHTEILNIVAKSLKMALFSPPFDMNAQDTFSQIRTPVPPVCHPTSPDLPLPLLLLPPPPLSVTHPLHDLPLLLPLLPVSPLCITSGFRKDRTTYYGLEYKAARSVFCNIYLILPCSVSW
jgi:hypothetical protein